MFYLVYVAEQVGFSLTLSEIPKDETHFSALYQLLICLTHSYNKFIRYYLFNDLFTSYVLNGERLVFWVKGLF